MRFSVGKFLGERGDRKKSLRRRLASELLDPDWYAAIHDLHGARSDLMTHCAEVAFQRGLAPRPSMASKDGVSLAPWAMAALRRFGVQFRAPTPRPLNPETDGALTLEEVRNDRGVRLAVVTSIIGPFDGLPIMPASYAEAADFYVVTDRAFDPFSVWRPVCCPFEHENPRIRSRFAKANLTTLFSGYEWMLWVDGNVCLLVEPTALLEAHADRDVDVAFFAHGDRRSLVEEVEACHRFGKDKLSIMMDELGETLANDEYKDDLLLSGSVFIGRPGGPADAFFSLWWSMIQKGSQRDQLSLPIALRRSEKLNWRIIPGHPRMNPYFKTFNH